MSNSLGFFFESHPDPMLVYDPETMLILEVNRAATSVYGYSRDEFLSLSITAIRPPEDIARVAAFIKQLDPNRRSEGNMWRHLTKDGRVIYVNIISEPIVFNGNAARVVAVHDINATAHLLGHERGQDYSLQPAESSAEQRQRLAKYEANLRMAQRLLGLGFWSLNLETRAIVWSDNIYEIYGVNRNEFGHCPEAYFACVHPDDRSAFQTAFEAFLTHPTPTFDIRHRILRPDGRVIHIRGVAELSLTPAGRVLNGVIQDTTEQHDVTERLHQAHKMEAVGQLTGGIAHDFNNLLTVIMGNAELLKESLEDQPSLRIFAEMSSKAAERGAELTSRLLAFARRQPLEPDVLETNKLVAGIEALLRRALTEDVEIELVRGGGVWPIEVDAGQLESAILNLAINARDAMPDGGKLTVETANAHLDDNYAGQHHDVTAGQYVMISVSDTGSGMPADVANRAFDPFYTTKPVGKGSGLGLSMVYGFVKQSGGHIKIYSEPGEGTTIRLYFPRANAPGAIAPAQTPLKAPQTGREHILAVEDDDLVRNHVVALLESLGYRVTRAASGPEALQILAHTFDIDLLFTDVVMPGGVNGRQLAEQAQALCPGLKILYTSGYTENAIVHHGRLDRGVNLLTKPYRRNELASKVRKVLDAPQAPG
ncbi:MAG: PAS domain-containing protein [Pusillimonas sp.]